MCLPFAKDLHSFAFTHALQSICKTMELIPIRSTIPSAIRLAVQASPPDRLWSKLVSSEKFDDVLSGT